MRIARELQLPIQILAQALGQPVADVQQHPDAVRLQSGLRCISGIWISLVSLYAGDKMNVRIFLLAPNEHLENYAPFRFFENSTLAVKFQ